MAERPALMWLSFYRAQPEAEPPRDAEHLGVLIVEASEARLAEARAEELAMRLFLGLPPVRAPGEPGFAMLCQGISAEAAEHYRPHLNKLMKDRDLLEAFGADGVVLEDGKTPLGALFRVNYATAPVHLSFRKLAPNASDPAPTVDDDLPIESPPFED